MKKISYLIILCLLSAGVNAQQAIKFKYGYSPNKTYTLNTKTNMDMEMTMGGDSATVAKLAAGGMKQPMLMKMDMTSEVAIKTDAATPAKTIPFTMTYKNLVMKTSVNGVETPTPKNPLLDQVIKGAIDAESKLHIDTITGTVANEQMKAAMTKMVNAMQAQIKFPEKPLAIGETFTNDIPMSIPAASINMDFALKTSYKLTAIKDNLAYFDTMANFDMDLNTQTNGVAVGGKGTGGGPGKMVFNIKNNFPQSMIGDIDMNFNVDAKPMKISMKIKAKSDIQYMITAN
jgi:hypothetical protein